MWGNGTVVYFVLVCVFFLPFSLSNSFFCALWCSIQLFMYIQCTCSFLCRFVHEMVCSLDRLSHGGVLAFLNIFYNYDKFYLLYV